MKICKKVQYFVNLQDLPSRFSIKELLCMCFRTNLLLLYISLSHIFTKGRQLPSNQLHIIFKVNNTKTLQKLWNVYKGYNKDNGANSIDVVLVSLLLTFNIGIVCRIEVSLSFLSVLLCRYLPVQIQQ